MELQLRRVNKLPTEERLAELLGLTIEEYYQLSHSGVREIKDLDGKTMSYYLVVSPLNPEGILKKLKMDKFRRVHFAPDTFSCKDLPVDEAV